MFYEELYNVKILDFGLIPHPDFEAFGASPDGICDDTGNNEYIGRVGIIKPAMFKEPDLAWQVFEAYEGKGYAYEAAMAVKDYAINNFKLTSLASHIVEGNKNSISLAERVGFKLKTEEVIDNIKFIIYFHI